MGSNGLHVADRSTDQLLRDFQSSNGTGNGSASPNGDRASQAAFEEIVRRYAGMVYTVCLQVTRDAHDAEDATQAAFLTLALRAKTAQNIKYLGPWLQKVSRRLSLDIMRAKKRRKRREERRADMFHRMQPDRDPRQGLDRAELADIVRDELHKLPSKYRLPLILHYYGGLRPEEVARELGYKPSTLGVRLHRGRKMLADSLAGRGITLSNAMLGTILTMVLHQGVCDNAIAQASLAAAGLTVNGELPAAIISARVLSLTRPAAAAAVWGKAKAAIATLLLAGAALAGSTGAVRDLLPHDWDLSRLNPVNWLRPLMRSILPAPQFGTSQTPQDLPKIRRNTSEQFFDQQFAGEFTASQPALDAMSLDSPTLQAGIDSSLSGWSRVKPFHASSVLGISSGEASMSLAHAARFDELPGEMGGFATNLSLTLEGSGHDGILAGSGVAFDASTRSLMHSGGMRRFDSLVLDSTSGTAGIQNYILTGSAHLVSRELIVGDRALGSFRHDGGQVQVAGNLILGHHSGSSGSYQLNGLNSRLAANHQYVGYSGHGQFTHRGGSNVAQSVNLGFRPGSRGSYRIDGGTLQAQEVNVGVSGTGHLEQTGGNIIVATAGPESPPGTVVIGVNPDGRGTATISGGTLSADSVVIGQAGIGQVTQTGGTIVAQNVTLGAEATGHGILNMTGGNLALRPGGSLTVGGAGTGVLLAGDAFGGANIFEQVPQSGAAFTVRAEPGGDGIVRGSGNIALSGDFVQNGRVIADGHDWPRELDMSSARQIINTIDNPHEGGSNGWEAINGGKLVLPPIDVTGNRTGTFGEDPSDPVLDLVNSVRFTVHDVISPGKAVLSLLAPDHIMVPQYPPDQRFIGVWAFDRKGLEFESTDLRIRYDDAIVEMLGADESSLQLWTWDGEWQLVEADLAKIDPTLNLLDGVVGGNFRLFGVSIPENTLYGGLTPALSGQLGLSADGMPATIETSIPEPTSAVIAGILAAGALLARRRR